MFYNNYIDQSELNPISGGSGVSWVRPELVRMLNQYRLIDDCLLGEQKIKDAGVRYLPDPDETAPTSEVRYESYRTRAVFYNVAGRTLEGLTGRVFTREPAVEVPPLLMPVVEDASGEGVSLDQLTQKAVSTTLAKGRAGIFVNYPIVAGFASALQLATGEIKPSIHVFQAQQIINWRSFKHLGKDKLSLVVLVELYTAEDDGFASKQELQYRVLRLRDGVYETELHRRKQGGGWELAEGPYSPTDFAGKTYDEIPFRFCGPRESNSIIEKPPMYDLCSLNIAHFRNSADYEESCFVTGQSTVWVAGLTKDWVTEILGSKIKLGARGVLALPEKATVGLLQAEPNNMPFAAMEHKERQMVALGAKLVEQSGVQRTATEASYEEAAETSVLSSVARNVSNNMQWALQWCGYFVGIPENSVKFDLNTDFGLSELSSDQRRQLVSEWQAEAITFTEMRSVLRRAGIATLTDEEALKGIEADRITFAPEVDPSLAQDELNFPTVKE